MNVALCFLLAGALFAAGPQRGGKPAPRYALDALDTAEITRTPADPRLALTGVHRRVAGEALAAGAWETSPEGKAVWRLALSSPGALGLRVHFAEFDAGAGRVWLRNPQAPETLAGPYTGRGVYDDRDFWSATVFGEEIELVYEAAPSSAGGQPPFRITEISHQYRSLGPQDNLAGASGPQPGACHLDASCYPEWQDSAAAVAMIVLEMDEGQAACSGALLKTRFSSGLPYFLTANHCVPDAGVARTVEAYWFYQTPSCKGAPPSLAAVPRSPVGARYLVSKPQPQGDFSFLLLPSVPPGVKFAGWDTDDPPVGAPVAGVHHPEASYKRISFGERYVEYWGLDYSEVPDYLYFQVLWHQGIVEPGSSGSPLFSRPGVVAGVLSYGYQFGDLEWCSVDPSIAAYGRFSNIYPYIKQYLEDPAPTRLSVAPEELRFQVSNGAVTPSTRQTVVVASDSADPIRLTAGATASWLALSAVAGAVSASSPLALDVDIKPAYLSRAGKYSDLVTLIAAGGVTRTLPVTVETTVKPSAAAVAVSPNPVVAQPPDSDGCQWFFTIRLQETAGVATRLTVLRIDGVDYSTYIRDWFGGDLVDAFGLRQIELRSGGLRVPADQMFEFGGADPGSGQSWTRSVNVSFR